MKERTKAAAVFLDRDGTILRDVGYLCSQEQIEILPGVPEAIRLLKEKGYKIVVVTNQSAVARGRLSEKQLKQIHEEVRAQLARAGATLDAVYYCPHHPSEGVTAYRVLCDCRKPNTGMIRRASEELGLEPARPYVVAIKRQIWSLPRGSAPRESGFATQPRRKKTSQAEHAWRGICGTPLSGSWLTLKGRSISRSRF